MWCSSPPPTLTLPHRGGRGHEGTSDSLPPCGGGLGWGAKRTLLLALLFFISACGFQPLYGERGGAAAPAVAAMADTRIALIANRAGQELRNNLLDRMNPRGAPAKPRYELEVSLAERLDRLGIARDDSTTYTRITLTANFALREVGKPQPIYSGQSRWTNGFTVVASHFANLASEADARSKALREIGDDIQQKLGLHFSGRAG